MTSSPPPSSSPTDLRGLSSAAGAFFIWGLLPVYLKALDHVPVLQVTAHRLAWGCVFALAWLALRHELAGIRAALKNPEVRLRLIASAALITINWTTYIYGIVTERAVETSLGYFINPLLNVVLGVLVLRERLNPVQWTAVAIAAAGVAYLTWSAGKPPWIALTLAFSFGLYGLVRKVVRVDALAGFASETLLLLPFGAGYLIFLAFKSGRSALRAGDIEPTGMARSSLARTYGSGLMLHLTNPKAILFFGSLYAIGVPATARPLDLVTIIALVGVQSACIFHGYALLFSNPAVVRGHFRLRRWFEGAFALAFGFAGLKILTARLQ